MDPVSTLAVSALGPALGLAMSLSRRGKVAADDRRRLAALSAGADEGDWVSCVRDQVPLGAVDPEVARDLGELGLLEPALVERAESLSGVWAMRPVPCAGRWVAVACCAAASLAAGLVSGDPVACLVCSLATAQAVEDLWWRRVEAWPAVASVMLCSVGAADPALPPLAGACALAGGLALCRALGRPAMGSGDAWLTAALAACLVRCGSSASLAALLCLLCELVVARLALGARAMVPLAPFLVAPLAVAASLGW